MLSCSQGEKTDYSLKIQELQKQLAMDKEEAEKLQVIYIHDWKIQLSHVS